MNNRTLTIAAVGDIAMLRPPSDALYRAPWDDADLRLANLEAPLAESGVPAAKLIRLKTPVEGAAWLQEMRCDAVSLANNHIMDWGIPGLESTLAALDRVGVAHAGAAANAEQAARHIVLNVDGHKIAFLSWACTIPPGFLARADRPGLAGVRIRTAYAADAATLDEQPGTPPWVHTEAIAEDVAALVRQLERARAETDFVILALHWGVPPQWQSRFQGPLADYQAPLGKRLVEAGADLILGCHAHTVYGIEAIARSAGGSGLICYSLGNYVFHPLAGPRTLELDSPSLPYHAEERAENRETYVARLALAEGSGRLALERVELVPALLDRNWEATRPSPEQAQAIGERVAEFSRWRGTAVEIKDQVVTWHGSSIVA